MTAPAGEAQRSLRTNWLRPHTEWLLRLGATEVIVVCAGLAFVLAIVLLVAILVFDLAAHSDVWLEVAKGAIQLVVVIVFGGAVTLGVRRWEVDRVSRRAKDDYLLTLLRELVQAYHTVKSVRRTLHAYGFRDTPTPTKPLSDEQVAEFQKQMHLLVDSQLSMERVKREITSQREEFTCGNGLGVLLRTAERYVNHVIDDWEEHGNEIEKGARVSEVTSQMRNLRGFLGHARPPTGIKEVSRPLEEVERLIQAQRLGARRADDLQCLRQIVQFNDKSQRDGGKRKYKDLLGRAEQVIGYDIRDGDLANSAIVDVYFDPRGEQRDRDAVQKDREAVINYRPIGATVEIVWPCEHSGG